MHDDKLHLYYGGSWSSMFTGSVFLAFGTLFSLLGSALFPGMFFLTIALFLFCFRIQYCFSKTEVFRTVFIKIFPLQIAVHVKSRMLAQFSHVRLQRRVGGKGVSYNVSLKGREEFWIFGTNDKKRMTRDAETIAAFLGFPLDSADGHLVKITMQR